MFLLMGGAVMLGFVLIFLIAATSPKPEPLNPIQPDGHPLGALDAEGLGKIVSVLLDKMGLELVSASGGRGGEVEIHAVNPEPITGGKILIHCVPSPTDDGGRVNGLRVQKFISAVRSARVSKGLLFTTGVITPDARLEAEEEQVELVDRAQLEHLMQTHLAGISPEDLR